MTVRALEYSVVNLVDFILSKQKYVTLQELAYFFTWFEWDKPFFRPMVRKYCHRAPLSRTTVYVSYTGLILGSEFIDELKPFIYNGYYQLKRDIDGKPFSLRLIKPIGLNLPLIVKKEAEKKLKKFNILKVVKMFDFSNEAFYLFHGHTVEEYVITRFGSYKKKELCS